MSTIYEKVQSLVHDALSEVNRDRLGHEILVEVDKLQAPAHKAEAKPEVKK